MYTRTIKLGELEEGMKISRSVYESKGAGAGILLVSKNTVVDDIVLSRLRKHPVGALEIYSKEPPPGQEPAKREVTITLKHDDSHDKPKAKPILDEKLRTEAIKSIHQLFTSFGTPGNHVENMTTAYQCVSEMEKSLSQVVAAVCREPSGLVHINDLKSYDEYTYHHSLSVAILAIATGQSMGLDIRQLLRLARCAVLHDMGKRFIPVTLTNKRNKLTPEEFETMKNHAALGADYLKSITIGDSELWNGVRFHHERWDGKGYPKQLKGEEIPLFSRIVSVCDVYDAVTSYRSYRTPMLPGHAYELITCEIGAMFEYDTVQAFTKRLVLYPINTAVELSDGRKGSVIENNNSLLPVVWIWDTGDIVDLASSSNLNTSIARVMADN